MASASTTPTVDPPPAPTSPRTSPSVATTPQSATDASAQARAGASAARSAALSGWMSDLGTAEPSPTGNGAGGGEPLTPPTPTPEPAKPATTEPPKPASTTVETTPTKPAAGQPEGLPADPDKWPRSAKEWDEFKRIRNDNYRKRDERIATLEKELKAREEKLASFASAVDPKEHSAVREERDKLSEALRLAAVEKHPRFQAYYDGKLNGQVELAKRIVGTERAEAVAALLKLPESDYRAAKVEELMAEMSPLAASRLGGVLNAVDELRTEREQEVARAREDYDKAMARQQSEQQATQAAAKANAERLFDATLREAQSKENGVALLQLREGDDAWNAGVTQRINAAKNILFGQEKPEELVRAALAAVSFPTLLEAHAALQAEHDALKAQVAALRTATPGVQRGTASPPSDGQRTPSSLKVGSRPMQAAAEWIGLINQVQE